MLMPVTELFLSQRSEALLHNPGISILLVLLSLTAGVILAGLLCALSSIRRLAIRVGRITWTWIASIIIGLLAACVLLSVGLAADYPYVYWSIAVFLAAFTVRSGYLLKSRCEFWQEIKGYEFRKKRNVDLTSWKKVGPVFGTKSHFGHADWRFVVGIGDLNFLVQQILNYFEHRELSGTEAVSEVLAYCRYSNLRDYWRLVLCDIIV